jgi:hypothetical protein
LTGKCGYDIMQKLSKEEGKKSRKNLKKVLDKIGEA